MTQLSLAYIFQHQKLLVDQNLQLPQVEKLASDLPIHHNDHVIARDLLEHESIPEGYQLVPIRELIQSWSSSDFLQASRAVQLLEWRRNHKFCSHCGHATEIHPKEYAMVCPRAESINLLRGTVRAEKRSRISVEAFSKTEKSPTRPVV